MTSTTSKKGLRLLLINLLIFFLLVFLLDISVGFVLRKIYFKQNHGLDYKTTYILEKNVTDIVILGSSRANHHFVPSAFSDSLHMTCYNAGRDGNFILYQCAVLKSILKRYTPKIVLLDLLDDDFEQSPLSYDRLASLVPYYKTHPEIRPIVELKGPFEKVKMLSSIYPFNSLLISSVTGSLDLHNKSTKEDDKKGYLPLYGTWSDSVKTVDNVVSNIDTVKVNAFADFVTACKSNGVKLQVIISPTYKKFLYRNRTSVIADSITKKASFYFADYSNDPRFVLTPNKYFKDIRHLNNEGATMFTNIIIQGLK